MPDAPAVHRRLLDHGVLAGLVLADAIPDDPSLADGLLVCATEVTTSDEIARMRRCPRRRPARSPRSASRPAPGPTAPCRRVSADERHEPACSPRSSNAVARAAVAARSAPSKDALARIPADALRVDPPALPELNEPEVVRHYVNLSQLNFAVDTGFYPLGSCTMKFNPKLNEWAARLPGFAALHPLSPDAIAQGTLQLLWELEQALAEISGMRAVTLQPAAGAQGELTGILMIRAYHRARGDADRDEVLVPDSSHGTNPATASMAGYKTITIPSAADGGVDIAAFAGRPGATDRRGHDHEPLDARSVRGTHRRAARRGPCGRSARVHGRRQPQRDHGPLQARRRRLRCHALQRPQDVQHPHGGGSRGPDRSGWGNA